MHPNGDNAPATIDVPESILQRGGAMQQVRTSFCTAVAVQRPRSLETVRKRLMDEAALAGDDFYYGWGSGKNAVEGPSVKLALAAARNYGNCAVDTMPVQDLGDSWIFTASFIDLETGFTISRQFRQSKKWTVHGQFDSERKDDIRFQIGQSKAIRNVVMNAVPGSLIDQAIEKAKEGARARLEKYIEEKGIAAAQDVLIAGLAKSGVKEAAVLARAEVAERKALTVDHILLFRSNLKAIQDGQERAEDLFPLPEAEKAKAAKEKMGGKKPEEPKQEQPKDIDAEPAPQSLYDEIEKEVLRTGLPQERMQELVATAGAERYQKLTIAQGEKILAVLRELPNKPEATGRKRTPAGA